MIWVFRDDMGDDIMGFDIGPYHPSKPISSLKTHIIPHIIPHIMPHIVHKNVKIVVLSSKSTVPAGDLDLEK